IRAGSSQAMRARNEGGAIAGSFRRRVPHDLPITIDDLEMSAGFGADDARDGFGAGGAELEASAVFGEAEAGFGAAVDDVEDGKPVRSAADVEGGAVAGGLGG